MIRARSPWRGRLISLVAAGAVVLIFVVVFRALRDTTETVTAVPAQASALAAEQTAAQHVRAAAVPMEAYRAEHGSYAGATIDALRATDASIAPDVSLRVATADAYCLESTIATATGTATASYRGPGGSVAAAPCA